MPPRLQRGLASLVLISVLVREMEGTACGSRMPRDNPTYFDPNPGLVVRVHSWLLAGAAND